VSAEKQPEKKRECRYCAHYRRPRCVKHGKYTARRKVCGDWRQK